MKSTKCFLVLFLICFVTCSFISISHAELRHLEFAWNMKFVSDLAGFKMYQRDVNTEYDYNNPIAVIPSPNARNFILLNVPSDKDLYWVLRAYDVTGLESPDSNETWQLIDGPPSRPSSFRYNEIDAVDSQIAQ